jgi:hypothetical protein
MPYKLNKGVYAVRCKHHHCPFNEHLTIDDNIMGVTEDDVRTEALKMARDKAMVKHDSLYGRKHELENPEIRMVGGNIQAVGNTTAHNSHPAPWGVDIRRYAKGAVIANREVGEATICQVLEGVAYPTRNKAHRYMAGDCFGVSPLFANHGLSDVVAGEDMTAVAFYDMQKLRRSEPATASNLLARAMEDSLRVIGELGRTVERLRREVQKAAT